MQHYFPILGFRDRLSRSLSYAFGMILMLAAAIALDTAPVAAQDEPEISAPALPDDGPESGTLMLRDDNGGPKVPAIRLGSDMSVSVNGNIARVQVTQIFRNISDGWVEGVYLYPMPDNAAVDTLKMTVGNRVIIGKIEKRVDARIIYETAKTEGKKAGLVEQQRPNMFTNSVANIGPGETVMVVIEYQMPLKQLDGKFSLRLPLVVGPRYVPPHTLSDTASIKDAQTVSAAKVIDPRQGTINPVSISVDLAPGFEPANIESLYHAISVAGEGVRRKVTLAQNTVPQDRDFELSWISASASPTLALYREEVDGKHYVMASITPPVPDENSFIPPRELIFVIDNSGSMKGNSMVEAKASLQHALGTLRPQDHFNIIRFDDTMETLFDKSVAATPENIEQARNFTAKLEAEGGTEMVPALKAALVDHSVTDRQDVVRQIIFLTDGLITNEQELLESIGADDGNSRVFSVGIGSAPNNYLMSRIATTGRGFYTNIGKVDEVTAKMAELLDMLSRPSLQNLKATIEGGELELTPKLLPDLYAGEPLVLLGRGDSLGSTITVSGTFEKTKWTRTLDTSEAIPSQSVAKLWGRRRIEEIEADRVLRIMTREAANAAIEKIGLEFHIVTSQTSLVAVEEESTRPADVALRQEDLPINLPAGWDFDHLFGGETARAAIANAKEQKLTEESALQSVEPEPAEDEVYLSGIGTVVVTGIDYMSQLLAGLFALMLGLIGLLYLRRRQEA